MKRFLAILLAALCIAIVSTSGISSIYASSTSDVIPQWVKNNAKWWADGQISESEFIKGLQYLIDNNILRVSNQDEINKLKNDNQILLSQNTMLSQNLTQLQQSVSIQESKPTTIISNGTIHWNFFDSKGNKYSWSMPFSWYDYNVKRPLPISYLDLKLSNGTVITTYDYRKFVEPDFSKSIDQLYNNAGSDEQFIYETWFISSQMTTYSFDLTHNNLWPLEVFTRDTGDCKDTSILIASMLRSSEHTKNWTIKLVYLDAYHPDDPQTVNHMMLKVITDKNQTYRIESTLKSGNALHYWDNIKIFGWMYDV